MADLLIFDGDCGICTYFSEFVQNRTTPSELEIKPYQILNLKDLHQNLDEKMTSKSLYLLTDEGESYNRAKGVFEVMKRMKGIYKPFGFILSNKFFVTIFNPFYNWVAKNRAGISKKFGLNACNISKYN